MPEKDPNAWAAIWQTIPEPIKAALLSITIAFLRILYDAKETRIVRVALECALCGGITLAIFYGIQALNWPSDLGVFLGGAIGLVGADQVRTLARAFARRKLTDLGGSK